MKIKSIKKINNKESNVNDFCIYTDTDSLFYPVLPLLYVNNGPDELDKLNSEDIVNLSLPWISDVQQYINESFNTYAKRVHNVSEHGWNIKQELLASRGFWINAKKRYAQLIVRKGNVPKQYVDVKGLDSVRSSFPKIFRKFVDDILKAILSDKDAEYLNEIAREMKKTTNSIDPLEILIPTSVKEVNKYQFEGQQLNEYKTGSPAHVKAAINYNQLLRKNQVTDLPDINDGDKIMWAYLKDNPLKLESLAIARDVDYPVAKEYITKYIDRNAIFEKQLLNKLETYWLAMGFGKPELNVLIKSFFNFN